MTTPSFQIKNYTFDKKSINTLGADDPHEENWPVVYLIYNHGHMYIGETTNLRNRLHQHHHDSRNRDSYKTKLQNGNINVIFSETFNKSAALDLESQLIQLFDGDQKYTIVNRNDGICNRDYYNRAKYRETFNEVWERFRRMGIANKSILQIKNSGAFKFSPYKELQDEQLKAIERILENLDDAFTDGVKSLFLVRGDAGTGKTIVITYLAKLLADIQSFDNEKDDIDDESNFATFFKVKSINQHFKNKSIALVVPQPSLCGRIKKIFKKIDLGGTRLEVLSPIQFGKHPENFDITIVDEAHLLKVGITGNTGNHVKSINRKLFGSDKDIRSELDWIMAKSKHVVLVFSEQQRIRPANISEVDLQRYKENLKFDECYLERQMRSLGGKRYIDYIDGIFSNGARPTQKETFDKFEAKLFSNMHDFVDVLRKREQEYGLSRMVAGYAWKWKSKKHKSSYDIEIDGVKFRWNSTWNNWIGSKNAPNEVGSIYTVQGDDLNYVGVIIGNDLIYRNGKLVFNRAAYADSGAMKRSQRQKVNNDQIDDNDMLEQVLRTYRVLMNRAVRGVYIYACDPALREYLAKYF